MLESVNDLDLEENEAVRVEGANGRPDRCIYIGRVGSTILEVSSDRLRELSPEAAHYVVCAGLATSQTTIGEAFEFFHGDYEPEITYFCLGCGSTSTPGSKKCCGCPVGCEIDSVDWPPVPTPSSA
ncbi:hypothetical protein [Salinadaptatus halalkaliphilus]|nr:hypothetical protein [Salinadaptatus halalkaliphilus]